MIVSALTYGPRKAFRKVTVKAGECYDGLTVAQRTMIIAGLAGTGLLASFLTDNYDAFSPQTPVYTAARCLLTSTEGIQGLITTSNSDNSDLYLPAGTAIETIDSYDQQKGLFGRGWAAISGGDPYNHYQGAEATLRQCADFIREREGIGLSHVKVRLQFSTAGTIAPWLGQIPDSYNDAYRLGNKFAGNDAAAEIERMADQAHGIDEKQAEKTEVGPSLWQQVRDTAHTAGTWASKTAETVGTVVRFVF